jgi:diacylglycerol kinase (ATP)
VSPFLQTLAAAGVSAAHGLTREPGDEARVTGEALERGFRRIVAVGGDGTWSNVAGAILRSGLPAELGLVPGGTGCDLAKALGIPPKDLAACAGIVKAGNVRTIDVGTVEDRHFLNIVGFGFDIAVIEDSWTVTWLGGDLLYLYCALRQLARFPGFPVEVSVDGGEFVRRDLLMLIVSNGLVFGGGFKINPRGALGDGRLDATAFRNMPLHRRLGVMVRLLQGAHESSPDVVVSGGARFRLRFPQPPAYETDGEWNRARSAELEVALVPRALRVLAPPA